MSGTPAETTASRCTACARFVKPDEIGTRHPQFPNTLCTCKACEREKRQGQLELRRGAK